MLDLKVPMPGVDAPGAGLEGVGDRASAPTGVGGRR